MKKCGLKRAYAGGGFIDTPQGLVPDYNTGLKMREEQMRMQDMVGQMRYANPAEQAILGNEISSAIAGFGERYMPEGSGGQMSQDMKNAMSGLESIKEDLRTNAKYYGGSAPVAGAAAMNEMTQKYTSPPKKQQAPQGLYAQSSGGALETYNKLLGFKQGGTVGVDPRGFINGPGGVDNVPARVDETGEEIRVGAGERIVNKQQNAALEALAAEAGMSLDEYLASATGEPVGPTMKHGLRAAAGGWLVPYDPVQGQQAAPGGANTYAPRSTVPIQDGVRMGGQRAPQRPNWIDPTKQVATIDSVAQRVPPQQAGTSLVPTNGSTQFHDKITAEEMARGNQNRAAGFKAAAEAKASAQAAPNVTTPTPPAPPKGGLAYAAGQRVGRGLSAAGGSVSGWKAPVAGGVMAVGAEMLNSGQNELFNDETVSVADKGRQLGRVALRNAGGFVGGGVGAGAGSLAGPVGTVGGGVVGGTAGYVGGDKLGEMIFGDPISERRARLADEARASLNKGMVDGSAPGRINLPSKAALQAKSETAKALRTNDGTSVVSPTAASTQETFRVNDLDRALVAPAVKSGRADFTGKKDATEYELPSGSTGGFVTRGKGGLRDTTYLSGAASAADAARDKQFAAAGYGKDAYGNWMTPQRIADKQALEQIQRDRAQFSAFSDQITDPKARSAGLRRVAFDMANDAQATKRAQENAKLRLEAAKYDQEERKIANLQGNSDREFEQKVGETNAKRLDDYIKAKATKEDGKLDGQAYSRLQEYVGNFKSKHKEGTNAYYKDLMDNLGVDSAFMADEGSLLRRVRNQGSDVAQGLRQQDGMLWGKYLMDPSTNRQVSFSDIAKMPASQRAIIISRMEDSPQRTELLKKLGVTN